MGAAGRVEPCPHLSQYRPRELRPCRGAKTAFIRAPDTSIPGPERTLEPAQTGTHQALFWVRRSAGDGREGGKERRKEGGKEAAAQTPEVEDSLR